MQVGKAQEGLSMQRTITPIWSDTMYKGQDLAELTFDEAIERELLLNRSLVGARSNSTQTRRDGRVRRQTLHRDHQPRNVDNQNEI